LRDNERALPSHLTSRFAAITVGLAIAVGAMIGLVLAGSLTPSPANSAPRDGRVTAMPTIKAAIPSGAASFADIAEQLNPSVVTIDASARGTRSRRLGAESGAEASTRWGAEAIATVTVRAAAPARASWWMPMASF
jgi:hypothetical protein